MNEHNIIKLAEQVAGCDGKITLVEFEDFGGVIIEYLKVSKIEARRYAQHRAALYMEFTPKGGRRERYRYITPDHGFAVFSGWKMTDYKAPASYHSFSRSILYSVIDSFDAKHKLYENTERTRPVNTQPNIYKVVGDNVEYYDSMNDVIKAYEQTGTMLNDVSRRELQGTPQLKGLVGPMYDGEKDGRPVIRYETRTVYNRLSH